LEQSNFKRAFGEKTLGALTEPEGVRFLEDLYADWQCRMLANPEYGIEDLRAIFEGWHKPTLEPENVRYSSSAVHGVPVIVATGPDDEGDIIIYCHGGGFCVGSADSRRKLGGHLAKHLRASVVIMDYRLAPEHPFPAAIQDSVAVYLTLRAEQSEDRRILMAGDSAGGNLAIATALKLRDLGEPLPVGIIAFSPWLDMENSGETIETNSGTDLLVNRGTLENMAAIYLSGASPTDPLANPLKADLTGLPPVYVNAGSSEALLSDTTRFAEAAKGSCVDVTVSIVEGMQHVFPCLAGRAQIVDDEIAKIAIWYRTLVTINSAT
jgi:epsilon-lactone hydrolase